MGEKLAVLHDKVRIGGRIVEVAMHYGREDARIWQRVARDGDSRRRLAVRVVGRQEARETGVRLAPGGMLEVVAAAICVPVGEVRVALDGLVLFAARHRMPGLARVQIDPSEELIGVGALECADASRRRRRRRCIFRIARCGRLELLAAADCCRGAQLAVAELRGLSQLQSGLIDGAREAVSQCCLVLCFVGTVIWPRFRRRLHDSVANKDR